MDNNVATGVHTPFSQPNDSITHVYKHIIFIFTAEVCRRYPEDSDLLKSVCGMSRIELATPLGDLIIIAIVSWR